jgi:hypothetical protein
MRDWLLVADPELRTRDRFILAALRVVLGSAVLVSAVVAVLPWLVGPSHREHLGDIGVWGLIVLCFVLPLWLTPYAIWQSGTVKVDADVLIAYTLRDRREIDLSKIRRVRTRVLDGRGARAIWAELSGPGVPSIWLNWNEFGLETSDRLENLVRDVASRPGVQSTALAKAALKLPGATARGTRLLVWLGGIAWPVLFGLGVAALIVAYVYVAVETSPP